MSELDDVEAIRGQLEALCRMPTGRTNWPEIEIANKWRPFEVVDPITLARFNDAAAWEFIADCLRKGVAVRYKPPSGMHPDNAYELIAPPPGGTRSIYMKVAIRPGVKKLIGISFHYERHP